MSLMTKSTTRVPRSPPPWFVHTAWRLIARCTDSGAAASVDHVEQARLGALRLTTIGRKSGQERSVIIGYLEDGPNLVALAMNGWDEGHPSWWLNLEAHSRRRRSIGGQHPPGARTPSVGEERDRLWQRWVAVDPRIDALCRPAVDRDARDRPRTARRDRLTAADDGAPDQADEAFVAQRGQTLTCESEERRT